jgi:hypothetical protein
LTANAPPLPHQLLLLLWCDVHPELLLLPLLLLLLLLNPERALLVQAL